MVETRRRRVRVGLVFVALVVMALNLRMGISSVGPVLPHVLGDLRAGLVVGSMLTTLPVVMMGLMSPWSARLGGRFGAEPVSAAALAIIASALVLRLWTGDAWPLLLLTAVILGGGIAAGNTMLPSIVGTYFPEKAALMTGVYTVGINIGAGSAAYLTPGLAAASSSTWRSALAFWAIPAALAAVLWAIIAARTRHPRGGLWLGRERTPGRLAFIAVLFGLQSMSYYAALAWLAPLYEEHGWTASRAGLLVFVFTGTQIVGSMLAAFGVQWSGRLVGALRLSAVVDAGALGLVAFTPMSAPWLFAVALGLGTGAIFTLALTVPLQVSRTVDGARRLTGLMLCYGYLLAATGPFIVSLLRSVSGGFVLPFAVLSLVCVAAAAVARPAAAAAQPAPS